MNILCGVFGVWCQVSMANGDPGPAPFCGAYGEPVLQHTATPGEPPVWVCMPKHTDAPSPIEPTLSMGGIELAPAGSGIFEPPANTNCEKDETAVLVPTSANTVQWRCVKTDAMRP